MKHLTIFLLLLTVVNFIGCSKRANAQSYIVNNSSEQLSLEYVKNDKKTAVIIEANTTYLTHFFEGNGATTLSGQCCICEFDSIVIAPSDTTKQLIRSITSEEDWDKSSKDFGTKTAEVYCRFIITDNDIE